MGQFPHQLANNLPLDQLVASALSQLEKLRYSVRSLRRYRTIWGQLTAFALQTDIGCAYSEDLAERFREEYRIRDGDCIRPSEGWRRHIEYGVKVLGDFARDGCIERFVTDTENIRVPQVMKKPLRDYEQYCRERRYLRESTLRVRIREIAIFLDFMGSRNVTTLDRIQPADLTAFITSLHRFKPKTVSRIVSDMRSFLQFLLLQGILKRDLSQLLPTIRIIQDAAIPSVWHPELVVKLLNVVDRSSPRGKRDYAILLLACRLGLRLGDIRTLTLDNLKWEAATIEITQSKTGAPLCLPLTEEVGEALIDYLKTGRPQSDYREVFLRLIPPFTPFPENTRFNYIVKHWKEFAGIQFQTKQHQGLHSLRHTLATELLREETPFHVISEILGHATMASTLIYAKADAESLRGAALNTEEVRHAE